MRGEGPAPREERGSDLVPTRVGACGWPDGFASGRRGRRAALVLAGLQGITPSKLHALAWTVGSAEGCLASVRKGRAGSEGDRRHALSADPDAVAAGVRALGARVVLPGDEEYPARLDDLHDPPVALFVVGWTLRDVWPAVAVVGSRRATDTGLEVAREIGRGMASAGVWVVSGAARGIDSAAHLGALDVEGRTLAVLAGSIDEGGRSGRGTLLGRIARAGTLVTEYPPGVPSAAFRFPARNRLLVGLSSSLVVVEGAERSGTLISVDHALSLGRPVYAVPGAVTSPQATVPLSLIRDGAVMIRGSADLLQELGIDVSSLPKQAAARLDPIEEAVLGALAGPTLPESAAGRVGLSVPEVVGVLMRLEMRGLVLSAGGRFRPRLAGVRRDAAPSPGRGDGDGAGEAGLG